MKKIVLSISVIVVIIFITIYNTISLAASSTEDGFLSIDDSNIQIGSDLLLNINIDKVDYSNFKIVINSSIQMDDVSMTEDSVDGTEVSVDENNELTLIGDKSLMNVNQVTLKYGLSDNLIVGSKITINAQLTNLDDESSEVIDRQLVITVVEKQENEQNNSTNTNSNMIDSPDDTKLINNSPNNTIVNNNKISSNNENSSAKLSNLTANRSGSSATSQEEIVVYNGSNNNYLSSLTISGYELNTDFSKNNSTYFIKASGTDNLTVNAAAEDSSATVNMYGNDNLKEGTNKILISVTAENGNVRTYRIYVIVN